MAHDHLKQMLENAIAAKQKNRDMQSQHEQVQSSLREMVASIAPEDVSDKVADRLEKAITPVLERLLERDRVSSEDISRAISQIKLNAPEMHMPEIRVPEPKITVNVPKMSIPNIVMPEEMVTRGWLHVMGYDKALLADPLPVQLRDASGMPINLGALGGSVATGGKADYLTIKGFSASAYADYLNADNRLRVSVETGSTGLTDTELRATAVPVSQVSGSIWSTAVIDIFGSTAASGVFNADNRIKVSVETGGSGLTDAELRATAVPVSQVSGAIWSTEATQSGTWNITSITNSAAASIVDSSGVQYSGSNPVPITIISGSLSSTGAYLINGDGSYRGTMPVEGTVAVSGVTNSIAANIVDSGGVAYTTSNPLPIGDAGGSITIDGSVSVTGSITSTVVVGPVVSDAVDDASAPVQQGGIARTANPTAVAGGDVVKSSHDDLGRQLMRPVQVRDLIQTAYVQLTNGTETTLLAASAGSFHDLIYVMGANNSDAAVSVDIRPVTAGNVIMTIQVPANGTAGIACPVPLPQSASDTGNNWTADMSDITGTTVSLTALFTREV